MAVDYVGDEIILLEKWIIFIRLVDCFAIIYSLHKAMSNLFLQQAKSGWTMDGGRGRKSRTSIL